jgi:hypothetical protein
LLKQHVVILNCFAQNFKLSRVHRAIALTALENILTEHCACPTQYCIFRIHLGKVRIQFSFAIGASFRANWKGSFCCCTNFSPVSSSSAAGRRRRSALPSLTAAVAAAVFAVSPVGVVYIAQPQNLVVARAPARGAQARSLGVLPQGQTGL